MSSQTPSAIVENVPLSEMLATLRDELLVAMREGENRGIRFQMEKVEVELKVALTKKSAGKAGIEFWVLSAGGEHELERASTHTFRLTMTPVSPETGDRVAVASDVRGKVSNE